MAQMQYLGDAENLEDLVSRIPGHDRDTFKSFGNLRIESAFEGRLFAVYKATGLGPDNQHRPPNILTTLKVLGLTVSSKEGAKVRIADLSTGEEMVLDYIPKRVFGYELFMAVPPFMRLRWDCRIDKGGVARRSMAFALLVKSKNRSDFYSCGRTYAETPNRLRGLYPHLTHSLSFF